MKKFTLQFISDKTEKAYRESQHSQIKEQFTLFTIQTILFFSAYILYYFETETFNLLIVANILGFMFLLVVLKQIINTYPQCNEYILPCLQIYFAYIWNIDDLFGNYESYDDSSGYDWCYGFQAFYFHFVILQLGYQIWPQAIILIGIYLQYVLYYESETLEYAAMSMTMFLVFVGIIVTKYTNEKTKRSQFIDNQEKQNWIQIIDEVLEQSILVIRLDEKQDQLVLQQINQLSKMRLKIQNNKDLRVLLRNMYILTNQVTDQTVSKNLEDEVRMFIQNENQKLIPSLEVRSSILKSDYKVKLMQSVVQEQQCIIMVLETNQSDQIRQLQQEILAKEMVYIYFFTRLKAALTTAKSRLQCLYPLINLQILSLCFQNDNLMMQSEVTNYNTILRKLKGVFGRKTKILIKNQEQSLIVNSKSLIYMIISVTQLFNQIYEIKLKEQQEFNVKTLKIKIYGTLILDPKYQKLLQKNNYSNNPDIYKRRFMKKMIKLIEDQKLASTQKQQIITILLSQALLWFAFNECRIYVKTKDSVNMSMKFQILL